MIKSFALRNGLLAALAAISALTLVDAPEAIAATVEPSDHVAYVLFASDSDSTSMSGSTDDIRRARALRSGREALLYVRTDGVGYVVRDPATLSEAHAIMKPQQDMGERQGELGRRQGELGKQQAKLGAEQARLGALQADARPSEAGKLAVQQGELGRQQGELGKRQGELGRQQGLLGEEQARLGRIAQGKIRALIANAIRTGVAQRVN